METTSVNGARQIALQEFVDWATENITGDEKG